MVKSLVWSGPAGRVRRAGLDRREPHGRRRLAADVRTRSRPSERADAANGDRSRRRTSRRRSPTSPSAPLCSCARRSSSPRPRSPRRSRSSRRARSSASSRGVLPVRADLRPDRLRLAAVLLPPGRRLRLLLGLLRDGRDPVVLGVIAGLIAAKVVKRGSPPVPTMAIEEAQIDQADRHRGARSGAAARRRDAARRARASAGSAELMAQRSAAEIRSSIEAQPPGAGGVGRASSRRGRPRHRLARPGRAPPGPKSWPGPPPSGCCSACGCCAGAAATSPAHPAAGGPMVTAKPAENRPGACQSRRRADRDRIASHASPILARDRARLRRACQVASATTLVAGCPVALVWWLRESGTSPRRRSRC